MKSLIIGLGIGKLYQKVLHELGHEVITVDFNEPADYKFWQDAVKEHREFYSVHVCTPNFTHKPIAQNCASLTKFLFVEKPGLSTEQEWKNLVAFNPKTRIMMVKNNMWRENIDELRKLYAQAQTIKFNWMNQNRVPKPGSWFTNKKFAFGGVSRDLMPHLLSMFVALDPKYYDASWLYKHSWQKWQLEDLLDSDYGIVDKNGIYDVDDHSELECTIRDKRCFFNASWRTLKDNDIGLWFDNTFVELGLCPESAYKTMLQECFSQVDNNEFWNFQLEVDSWIHRKIVA